MNSIQIKRTALGISMLLATSLPVMAALANAEIIVIGSPGLSMTGLTSKMISDLYLGKTVRLSTGQLVEVIDLPIGHHSRQEFYRQILKRNPEQIDAYWAKRIFTGKGLPPDIRPDENSVVEWVSEKDGRIGYVHPDAIDDRGIAVKILYRWIHRD